MRRWRHVFLLSSLPRLAGLDAVRSLPIGQSTLRYRLAVLEPAELSALAAAEALLRWPAGLGALDEGRCLKALREAALTMPDIALRGHCASRLQTVAVLGALRARCRSGTVPPGWLGDCGDIGVVLKRRWSDPDFGLAVSHPWLGTVSLQFAAGSWEALERGLIRREYTALTATQAAACFGFEAVAAYVLRWSLLARWLEFDAQRAAHRLARLLDAVLARGESLRGN
jgi:hypothetical protein